MFIKLLICLSDSFFKRCQSKLSRVDRGKRTFFNQFCVIFFSGLTVAGGTLDVFGHVFSKHGLWAAHALPELGPASTFTQQVLRNTRYLYYLWRCKEVVLKASMLCSGGKPITGISGVPVCTHHSVSTWGSVSSSGDPALHLWRTHPFHRRICTI